MNINIDSTMQAARLFSTDGEVITVKHFGDGLINDTYIAVTDTDTSYVLQRINHQIFKDVEVLQHNLRQITTHIHKCLQKQNASDIDRKVLTMIPAKNGKEYVLTDGEYWRMTKCIAGSHTHSKVTPEMAELTGKAFAQFHTYFTDPQAPELQETIPNFHNVGYRIDQLRQAVAENKTGRLTDCRKEAETLLAREDEMTMAQRLFISGKLPRRTAHCDTKLNNILFDADGSILCVIDLDTTMPGFVLSDFGDFIRTAANTGREDDPNLDDVNVNMDIFHSFARGYIKAAAFLSPTEKRLLPFGAKMLTYMQAVRFLTDYINGDTYYKIQYPKHNLVRTHAQMKLLQSIDAQFAEMEAYIATL